LNHWPFIIAAYALAILGTLAALLWSWIDMRRAEADAEALRRER
jgi:hypothetical protein